MISDGGAGPMPAFDDPDLPSKADGMTQAQLDALPFGVVKLDADGKILAYNRTEEEIGQVEMDRYLRHDFFRELAPCMDVPSFRGVFQQGIDHGRLQYAFEFESDADSRAGHLKVRMHDAAQHDAYWLFLKRL
jgi:photoactive yellow protein